MCLKRTLGVHIFASFASLHTSVFMQYVATNVVTSLPFACFSPLDRYARVRIGSADVVHCDVPLRLVREEDGDLLAALGEDLGEVGREAEVRLGYIIGGDVVHLEDFVGQRREFDLQEALCVLYVCSVGMKTLTNDCWYKSVDNRV